MYAANPIRIQPIFVSIIFHHYQTLKELRQKVVELDNRIGGYYLATGRAIDIDVPRKIVNPVLWDQLARGRASVWYDSR
jgi:hypothetical protein